MGIELVHDEHDPLRLRIMDLDQVPDTPCPVDPRPLVTDPDLPPTAQGRGHEEQVDAAAPDVCRVVADGATRPCRAETAHRPGVGGWSRRDRPAGT